MAEIYVQSSSALDSVITELRTLNGDFNQKAIDIEKEQGILTQKWEGDASEAFQEHFRKEYPNFANFYNTIEEYIGALELIKGTYENAEQINKGIAQN